MQCRGVCDILTGTGEEGASEREKKRACKHFGGAIGVGNWIANGGLVAGGMGYEA